MISDNFGRQVRSLRLSVTDKCNQKCYYCHGEGQEPEDRDISLQEIRKILETASSLGIHKIKITGGEPLLRSDIVKIVSLASKYMEDVSLTTNGTLLAPLAHDLKKAGLARANISLDTFDCDLYKQITGTDMLDKVIEGIKKAVSAGLSPIKINIVVQPDYEAREIMDIVEKAWALDTIPQVIELINHEQSASIMEFEEMVKKIATGVEERAIHRRLKYRVPDNAGYEREVEIVKPMHNTEFCANCTRLRVTSDGHLKPCLMHNNDLVDFIEPMRNGANDEELAELFKQAIENRIPYWR